MLAAVPGSQGGRTILDPMIRDRKTTATEPRRVVLELEPSEHQALETLCRGKCCTVPEMVRLVALRLARAL